MGKNSQFFHKKYAQLEVQILQNIQKFTKCTLNNQNRIKFPMYISNCTHLVCFSILGTKTEYHKNGLTMIYNHMSDLSSPYKLLLKLH